jgi:RNA-directed DNA polymerase
MQQQQPQQQQLRSCGAFRRIINPLKKRNPFKGLKPLKGWSMIMFSFEQIYRAYRDCRKNKRNTRDALIFECNQEENIIQLVDALNSHSYQPVTSACFYIEKPKPREIFAADFSDRIVHHLIYNELAPTWEKIFIHHSYACRPEKGTHKASQELQACLRKITRNGKKPAFFLSMDIRNYFMSINKPILFQLLNKKCRNNDIEWLVQRIVFHDPTENYEMRSSKRLQQKVPQQKSLFHVLEDCGLPIGNLTSQFFANVYLNELDQFVKHVLKCRFYFRYVDNFILLSEYKDQLVQWKSRVVQFLDNRLLLALNERETKTGSVFNGADFVGFIVRPHYKLVRRHVVGNCKARLKKFQNVLFQEQDGKQSWSYDLKLLEKLLATMNSYLGHFRHAQTRNIIKKILLDFSFLNHYFYLHYQRLIRKYRCPRYVQTLKQQFHYYNKIFPNSLLLFQVGCYYEAYGKSAEQFSAVTGYQLKKKWRGFGKACGFHQRFLEKVCHKIEEQKISYVIIQQTGKYLQRTMERVPYKQILFLDAVKMEKGNSQ